MIKYLFILLFPLCSCGQIFSVYGSGSNSINIGGTIISTDTIYSSYFNIEDSLFLASERPLSNEADSPVEVGLSFSATKSGTLKAIKFWKTTTANIDYTVSIWSLSGERIFTTQYQTNRTKWNSVPINKEIQSGVYIASYYARNGRYGQTENFFTTERTRGSITGLMGFYSYDSKSTFPDSTYNSSQYGVDIVFEPKEEKPIVIWAGNDSIYTDKPDSIILKGEVLNAVSYGWVFNDWYGDVKVTGLNTLNPVLKMGWGSWASMVLVGSDSQGNETSSVVQIEVIDDPAPILKAMLDWWLRTMLRQRQIPTVVP